MVLNMIWLLVLYHFRMQHGMDEDWAAPELSLEATLVLLCKEVLYLPLIAQYDSV